jgi:hypothetical protein
MVILKMLFALLVYPSYASNFDSAPGDAVKDKTIHSTNHSYIIMKLDEGMSLQELESKVIEFNDQYPSHNCYLATFT